MTPDPNGERLQYERHLQIDFPTVECTACGESVEHRRERNYRNRTTTFECSNCHDKREVQF